MASIPTHCPFNCSDELIELTGNEHTFTAAKADIGINTDFNWESWCTMEETIKFQQEIIAMLSADLKEALFSFTKDQQTHYYTGLTSYAVFDVCCLLCYQRTLTPVKVN